MIRILGRDYDIETTNKLSLDNLGLSEIPDGIGELKNLVYLDLSFNFIKTIPIEIFNLEKLETLDLEDNMIEIIPPDIGNLKKLKYLDLDDNSIDYLPPEIGELGNLVYLHVVDNPIKSFPPEIGKLSKIRAFRHHTFSGSIHNEVTINYDGVLETVIFSKLLKGECRSGSLTKACKV